MAKRPAPDSFILDSSDCKRHRSDSPESSSSGTSATNASTTLDLSPEEIYSSDIKVCYAAVTGDLGIISAALSRLPPQLIANILNGMYYPQSVTPLALAALHGHMSVIQLLLETFQVDIEQSTHFYDNEVCYDSVLSVAALKGHLDIAKYLVNYGANVNKISPNSRSALHAACYSGHVNIVRYLLDRGARLDIVDGTDKTCLMTACMRDNTEVVRLLLEQGANPNDVSSTYDTAMHVAGTRSAARSARLLLKYRAAMTKNVLGRTPLVEAVLNESEDFINFILKSSAVSRQEKVDALELWGAVYISDGTVDEGFLLLCEAMTERFKDQSHILNKSQGHPVPVIDGVTESLTLADLQSRRHDPIKLLMESVLIFERILCPAYSNYKISHWPITDTLMERGCHREALIVWTRAWKRLEEFSVCHYEKLREILQQMCSSGPPPAFEVIAEILDVVLTDLEKLHVGENNNNFNFVRGFCIYLLSSALCVVIGEDKQRQVKDFARRLVQKSIGPHCCLLHQAIRVIAFYRDEVTTLNGSSVVALLLDSEADVNAMDSLGNTPLHEVAHLMYECESEGQRLTKEDALCSIMRELMERGAHADSRNNEGWTPLHVASPSVQYVLHEYLPLSLKCLAASTIVIHKIPYKDKVPKLVSRFIDLHFPG